jgi:hypothetical protein
MSDGQSVGTERLGELERFAVQCALRAAWTTEFWVPADPDYGFVDYFEAAAARNLGLLCGFEKLAEDADQRGILPPAEGDQAKLVTDGGIPSRPDPDAIRKRNWTCLGCGVNYDGRPEHTTEDPPGAFCSTDCFEQVTGETPGKTSTGGDQS